MFNLTEIVHFIVTIFNAISIIILLIGVGKAIFDFTKYEIQTNFRNNTAREIKIIKNYLGSYILLSLEILIAADIIETIMNPSPEDIFILAAVVVIRTVISYFLGKEIEHTRIE